MVIKTIAAAIMALMVCCGAQASDLAALGTPSNTAQTTESAARHWQDLRIQAAAVGEAERVWQVNAVINNLSYRSDMETMGVSDYWDTPLELVARGVGDCEDFAIAKYVLLLESGVSPERLKLAFAFYTADANAKLGLGTAQPKRTHVVVLYQASDDGDPIVMDLIDQMLPLSEREDLSLVFDFDLQGGYEIHNRQVAVGAVQRMMGNWIEVVRRGKLTPRAQYVVAHARASAPRAAQATATGVTTAMR